MARFRLFGRRKVADEGAIEDLPPPAEAQSTPPAVEADGMQRIKPVVRTYVYKTDATSCKRFTLLAFAVMGSFMWWLGPVLGLFVISPMFQDMLIQVSVITPDTDCYDFRLANQTCDTDVMVDYYFWNITNVDQWVAGTAPPAYDQVGPFVFKAKEVRYNVQYDANWTQVEYTYHQYGELVPSASCPACTLDANITSINRAYLQFLSAPPAGPVDPESAVIYQLMPMTLAVIRDSMTAAIATPNPSSPTLQQDVLRQWTDCSLLLDLGLPSPYLKDVPLPPGTQGFPYNPELCAYIPEAMAAFNVTVTPATFGAAGLAMDYTATGTFLALSIGQSNTTYLDPAASGFLMAFLTMPQATALAALGGSGAEGAAAAAALSLLAPNQWLLLQGYIASLVPTWGSLVMAQWLGGGGGGLIATKTVNDWLYGFDDPLLLTAAQGAAAAAGAPDSYLLTPWMFKPSVALNFESKTAPIDYFEQVTGTPYNFSILSWKSTDIGFFHPLIQQKRLWTGKGSDTPPQGILQYRGVPYFNRTWAITNVTGINEGIAMGLDLDVEDVKLTFDTPLSRPITAQYTGQRAKIKKATMLIYNMTDESVAPCNLTEYGIWAGTTGFDPVAYQASVGAIPPEKYWEFMANDTALSEFLESSPLGSTLEPYFGTADVGRDRCAAPEAFAAMWDLSPVLACPTIYTFPHFLNADPTVVSTTGATAAEWAPDPYAHGYRLAVEPTTGMAAHGHKTYQLNHLVSATPNLYPTLWTAPGSGAAAGLASDFVTVPIYWLRLWWEPTDGTALLIRAMGIIDDVFYYTLVASWPVLGWALLGSSLFVLRQGRDAKTRRKELPNYQRSRARGLPVTTHEKEMVAALSRIARGSQGVVLPAAVPEGMSEHTEAVEIEAAADPAVADLEAAEPLDDGGSGWRRFERSSPVPRMRSPRVAPEPVMRADSSSGSKEEPLLLSRGSSSGSGSGTPSGSGAGRSTGSEAPLLP